MHSQEAQAAQDKPLAKEPKTSRGRKSLAKILQAAGEVFGAMGYHDASVSEITRTAGVAQGTFYIYFDSKEALFSYLVIHKGAELRHFLTESIAGAADRLDAERLGLTAFLTFVRDNPGLYRIVTEAQFVDPKAYRGYFEPFGEAYAASLQDAAEKGEIKASSNYEALAWAIMGISMTLGIRFGLMEPEVPLDTVVDAVHAFVKDGLKP